MSIVSITHWAMSSADYDRQLDAYDWRENPPQGALVHVAAVDDDGGVVLVNVWASREAQQAFTAATLPRLVGEGMAPPRSTEVYEVHNLGVAATAAA
jgi:hypothetical protein